MCRAADFEQAVDGDDAHVLEQSDLAGGVDWMFAMSEIPGQTRELRSGLDTAFGDGEARGFPGIDMAASLMNARDADVARRAELHHRLFGGLDSDASEPDDAADADGASDSELDYDFD